MKRWSTTPVSKGLVTKSAIVATAVVMVMAGPLGMMPKAKADKYDDQIRAIQEQIDKSQAEANRYGKKADTLQNAVARLTAEKNAIQEQVNLTQEKLDALEKQIDDTKQKIQNNKDALGTTMANLYVDGTISPLEMLASSKNIGDYVDKQTYQTSMRDSLSETIDTITKLKEKLDKQKVSVQRTLTNQQNAKKALAAKEQEKNRLLAKTRGKESAYKKQAAAQEEEKRKVQEQQQAAIAAALSRAGGGGTLSGGGSLASYESWVGGCSFDSVNALSYNNDPLGYGCNQCVSYAAYMMLTKIGYGPSYWGNANMWPASAENAGFTVSTVPRGNALGVMMSGPYGHIVYVDSYNSGAGTVNISQYNEWLPGLGYGYYSQRSGVPSGTYQYYIYL